MADESKIEAVGIISTALRRPATYAGHAREVVATARCAVLYPFGLLEKTLTTGKPAGDEVHDTPVVLVHGYGHNWSGWMLLERSLRQAGFTSVHSMNYVAFGTDGVAALAERLAARVDAVMQMTGADKVHLVGHSLGGILLRWYIQELGGDQFVDRAITIASPHEGTVAAFAGFGPAARDLRPGSKVLRRLAVSARPSGVRWVAMHSNLDLVVQPAASARLRAPALEAENVLIKDHGHVGIMISPVVVRAIVERLQGAETVLAPVLSLPVNRPRSRPRPRDRQATQPGTPVVDRAAGRHAG